MAILGIESAIYGVDDLNLCARFWEDFGLTPVARTADECVLEVASGSKVVVRLRGDPRLPAAFSHSPGIHETVWGVDTPEALEMLVSNLSSDREVRRDPDGTAHFAADDGMPFGPRVWSKRAVVSVADKVNTPGRIERLNQHRQWRSRARPKTINHVVFFVKDYVASILVGDYSRRGFIDGRSLRLPGIVARPPQPSGMLSAFMSDIIRNLSSGREFVCPVAAEGMAWWMSRAQVVDNLLHAAGMSVSPQTHRRVWLLPVLHASLGDVAAAIARVHGADVLKKVSYRPNPTLQAQFANLPPLRCPESVAAGFRHDGTLETLVQRALE